MSEGAFNPLTAREALLAIRQRAGGAKGSLSILGEIDRLAEAGLDRSAPSNFELTDELADRLAEAHKILGEIREGTDMATLSGEIDQALALPPDLEAMVERRIR